MPLWLGIGAGAGLLKNEFVDRPREQRQRKLAAETQRYSPWTGLKADPIQESDPFGNALQFGTTSAMFGSNIDLQKKVGDYYAKGGIGSTANMTTSAPTSQGPNLGVPYEGTFKAPSMGEFQPTAGPQITGASPVAQNSYWSRLQQEDTNPNRIGMAYYYPNRRSGITS